MTILNVFRNKANANPRRRRTAYVDHNAEMARRRAGDSRIEIALSIDRASFR